MQMPIIIKRFSYVAKLGVRQIREERGQKERKIKSKKERNKKRENM